MTHAAPRSAVVVGNGDVVDAVVDRLREEGDHVVAVAPRDAGPTMEQQRPAVVIISCVGDSGPSTSTELNHLCELAGAHCGAGVDSRVAVIADARTLRGLLPDPDAAGLHAAALGVVRRLARIHAAEGPTFNVVYAGPTDPADLVPGMAINRAARPDEIAHAAWIAVAPFAGFMTGTLLMADGGLSLGH